MKRSHAASAAVCLSVLASAATVSHAALLTWRSSASAGANWSDQSNWSPAQTPVAGDSLTFPSPVAGGTRVVNNDLTAGTSIAGIAVTANQYTLNGNNISLAGDYSFTAQSANSTAFTNIVSLPITLAQNVNLTVAGSAGTGQAASRVDLNSAIDGNFGLTKLGTGILRLQTNGRTYTGDTVISAGQLDLNIANGLPFGVGKGNLVVDAGATVLNLSFATSINGLNNGPNGAGQITRTGTTTRNWSIGNGDANGSFSGNFTNTGGSSTFTKDGLGTQTMGGTVTLAAIPTINAGRFNLDGTLSVGITAAANGTLGGTGTISGIATINGKFEPGALNASAVLAAQGLTLNAAAVSTFDVDGLTREANYDGVDLTTALTYGGTLNVDLGNVFAGGSTFDLFNFAAVVPSGSFVAINLTGAYTGSLTNDGTGTWTGTAGGQDFSFSQATGDLTVVAPEPTMMLGMVAGGLVLRRRRA